MMSNFINQSKENRKNVFQLKTYISRFLLWGMVVVMILPQAVFAGNNLWIKTDAGFVEDYGDPLKAFLNSPYGIAVDKDGSIYIADKSNHRVRKISKDENGQTNITTIAGTGASGYDEGELKATEAKLNKPTDVAIDSQGNIYIADSGNHCIRKVNTNGIISTYAGSHNSGFSGDGGLAIAAELNEPKGIDVDIDDNLYIADTYNDRIRFVEKSQQRISSIAGNGSAGFNLNDDGGNALDASLNKPEDIFVDSLNNVWIADTLNHAIRKVDGFNGKISTVAGKGEPDFAGDGLNAKKYAMFDSPKRVVLLDNCLYISDTNNNRIRKIDPDNKITTIFDGDSNDLSSPIGIAFNRDKVLFINFSINNLCMSLPLSKEISIFAGIEGQPPAVPKLKRPLSEPEDVIYDSQGNYYIANTDANTILMVSGENGMVSLVAGTGKQGSYNDGGNGGFARDAFLNQPKSILPLSHDGGKYLYLSEPGSHCIRRIDLTTMIINIFAGNGDEEGLNDVTRENTDILLTPIHSPAGLFFDSTNTIYFADMGRHCVYKIIISDNEKKFERIAGIDNSPGKSPDGEIGRLSKLNTPVDVWIDRTDRIFIVDSGNNRICVLEKDNTIHTVLKFREKPSGITGYKRVDGQEFLVVSNHDKNIIHTLNLNTYSKDKELYDTEIDIIAGTSDYIGVLSGDGGPALQANLNRPMGLTADKEGHILFSDMKNNRIRLLTSEGEPTLNKVKTIAGLFDPKGQALSLAIREASGLAIDSVGNIIFSDSKNHRVMKIDSSGKVKAVAGNGTAGYSGNGDDATKAQLNSPEGLLYINGILYIADKKNHAIRKVDQDGVITTILGNGFSGDSLEKTDLFANCLDEPTDIIMDEFGDLYVADSKNNRIIMLDMRRNWLVLKAGCGSDICPDNSCGDGGDAINAFLNTPTGITFMDNGDMLIADSGNHRIRIVYSDGQINTYANTQNEGLLYPKDVVADSDDFVYFSDSGNNRIKIIQNDASKTIKSIIGDDLVGEDSLVCNNENVIPSQTTLKSPSFLALDGNGHLFLTDQCRRILKVDIDTINFTNLNRIAGVKEPNFSGDNGPAISASLDFPYDIDIDKWGNIYFADKDNHRIRKISSIDGSITTIAGTGIIGDYNGDGTPPTLTNLNSPHSVSVSREGDIYISDTYHDRILLIKHDNPEEIITIVGGSHVCSDDASHSSCSTSGKDDGKLPTEIVLYAPKGIALDSNDEYLYIADYGKRKVRKVGLTQDDNSVTDIATYEELGQPFGVAVDNQSNVYVSDIVKHQVLLISPNQEVSVYAGDGGTDYFYTEENKAATSASLYSPTFIDLDSRSNLYILDSGHHSVRKVLAGSEKIVTIAGNYRSGFSQEFSHPMHTSFNKPKGICIGIDGTVYVSDTGNHYIRKIMFMRSPDDWKVEVSDFQHQGKIIVNALFDGNPAGRPGDRIAVFVGDECRGVADSSQISNSIQFFLQAWGNETEQLTFKYYRNSNNTVYIAKETITYSPGMGPITMDVDFRPPVGPDECREYKLEIIDLKDIILKQKETIDQFTQYTLTLSKDWYMLSSFNTDVEQENFTINADIVIKADSPCIGGVFEFVDGGYKSMIDSSPVQEAIISPLNGFWLEVITDSCEVTFKAELH